MPPRVRGVGDVPNPNIQGELVVGCMPRAVQVDHHVGRMLRFAIVGQGGFTHATDPGVKAPLVLALPKAPCVDGIGRPLG